MSELPKPAHTKEEAVADVAAQGAPGIAIGPMRFNEVVIGNYKVEWAFRTPRKDIIFHFFKRPELGGLFPNTFRSKLWNGFTQGFDLVGKDQHRVNIDWVPEADSWCVCVVIDGMVPPGEEMIQSTLQDIMS